MAESDPSQLPENWNEIGKQIALGVVDAVTRLNWSDASAAVIADILGKILGVAFTVVTPIGVGLAKGIAQAEDIVAPELQRIAAAAASDVFGQEVPASAFVKGAGRDGNRGVAEGLGAGLLNTVAGEGGEIKPGDEGAKRFLGLVVNMALEGWYQGWFFEFMSSLVPYFDVGKIENFGELDDTLAQALGLGRLSRRVIGPVVDATCVQPLEWKINKTYRQTEYTVAEALDLFMRDAIDGEELEESLARRGYSPKRIQKLKLLRAKYLSADDALTLEREDPSLAGLGKQALRNQGWDEQSAELALRATALKRINGIRDNVLSAVTRAYVDGAIGDSEMRSMVGAVIRDPEERAAYELVLQTQRTLSVKRLSHSEVIDLVREKILSRIDYRRWLEREGYEPEAAAALELRLAKQLSEDLDVEAERKRIAAERAAEKAAKAEAAAERKRQVEADRALKRRGSTADLERAVIRGLIPIARLEEVLQAENDPDTVAILVALVEDDRQKYLAQQQAAELARQRNGERRLDVGAAEQAVLQNVLTIEQFAIRLQQLGFNAADAGVLVATLRERKKDLDAAAAARAEAERRGKVKRIDVGRFETLVRRGLRTMSDYAALLRSLDFDEGAQAAMIDLLQLKIADDAAAAAERANAEPKLKAKGVSLELLRRAVLLGNATEADFERFLIDQGFTSDAQGLLLAELRDDVAEAEAARQRRAEADARNGSRALSLDRLARAARLGIIQPETYQQRLVDDGYTDDDIAVEMELLITEIADAAAARQRRQQLDADSAGRGLSLADLAKAVKAGVASIEDYRARAAELNYSQDDAQLLVALLAKELEVLDDARARRAEIGAQLGERNLSLTQLEAAVKGGLKTVEDYIAGVRALGYGADDAELLATLLITELSAKEGAG